MRDMLKLSHVLALLFVIGFIASLEASPIPLIVEPPRLNLTGYSLVVVPASAPGAEEVAKAALASGTNLVIVLDSEVDWLDSIISDVKPVRLNDRVRALLALSGEGNYSFRLVELYADYGLVLETFAPLLRAKGVAVPYTETPLTNLTLLYLEAYVDGSIVAIGSEQVLEVANVFERLSDGGPVLRVPRGGFTAAVGFFHASTLLWFFASMLDNLRATLTAPLSRLALTLLGLSAALLGLLPALALLTEQEPTRRRGPLRRVARRIWMLPRYLRYLRK